jgi:hypothetical protein
MGLVAVAASSALILGACGGGNGTAGQQGQSQQSGTAQGGGNSNAVASSCAAANQILDNTQSYTGKQVTFTGTVGQVVGPHAFTVAATGNNAGNNNGGILGGNNNANNGNNAQGGGTQLLAVDKETTSLTPGSPVQVTGTLQPTFDTNQAQTFTGGNLDQAAFTAYNGKPYVQAAFAGPVSANLANSNQGGGILGGGNNGSGCAAASQVLNNTQSYTGQQITVTGTVGQVVGPHAFTVAANGNNAGNNNGGILGGNNNANNGNNAQGGGTQTLLAVDKETTSLTPGSPVQVTGTLQPTFDTNQAQTFTGGNLDQAAFTAYNGKPYVQAVFAGPVSANLANNGQGR